MLDDLFILLLFISIFSFCLVIGTLLGEQIVKLIDKAATPKRNII